MENYFSKKCRKMFDAKLILIFEVFVIGLLAVPSTESLSFMPEFLWYKTCADSPPGFSPGCMNNVTVNIGERAVFNCQVDPRCHVQYLYWFHERGGRKRLIKTGRNATEPYVHEIDEVLDDDFGRYYCVIANVLGESECSAYLNLKNSAIKMKNKNPISTLVSLAIAIAISSIYL